MRIGPIILLVDADTVVPEDCFRDAAREFAELASQELAVLQHESGLWLLSHSLFLLCVLTDVPDVMQVVHHYFENGVAFFTRRINKCISMACANGEVAPFVGHNAFLRWQALQDAAFVDPTDGKQKIWSEYNVSEDFDMALRLQLRGYIIRYVGSHLACGNCLAIDAFFSPRWASYSNDSFKEGVSLTVDDELNRWQKYAYGCSE